MEYKSGFIVLVGRPNAGKSTFINALMQEKISIVSNKAQTTRNMIQAIYTTDDTQYVFIDTPGIHKPHHELGKKLNQSAFSALQNGDIVFYIADATAPIGKGDQFIFERLQMFEKPCFLLLNKIDLLSKEQTLQALNAWNNAFNFNEIFPISAITQNDYHALLTTVRTYFHDALMYFPKDMKIDKDIYFRVQELIREKVLLQMKEEIPHASTVVLEQIQEGSSVFIQALIIVERPNQKAMMIGKEGERIKRIRLQAQKDLRSFFQKKVVLELYVRVEKDWRNKMSKLEQFGYGNQYEK